MGKKKSEGRKSRDEYVLNYALKDVLLPQRFVILSLYMTKNKSWLYELYYTSL
jgi:hypothetical protein